MGLFRDEVIEKSPHQNNLGRSKPVGPTLEIEIVWKIRSPKDEPRDGGLSRRHPATDRVGALREPQHCEGRDLSIGLSEPNESQPPNLVITCGDCSRLVWP